MPRRCAFCNASGTSQEHIWPDWAAKYMATEGAVRHYLNVVQEGKDDQDRSWPQKAFSMTVGAVCRECNNGWMSELESRTKPFFEAAFQGRGRLLHAGMQRELAAWAVKTAMMVERQQGPARHVILPEEYRHLYEHREPSARILIWMASYSGTVSTAVGHMYGLDVTMEFDPNPDRGQRDIWGSTVVFGPVVFHLLGTNVPGLLEDVTMNTLGVHRLWPYEQSFTWSQKPGLTDADLASFMDGFLNELLHHGDRMERRARKLP
jgi:hypothetical protein